MPENESKIASGQPSQAAPCGSSSAIGCSLFLVLCDGKPYAAYPREVQAKVYASGFSRINEMRIVAGTFTENPTGQATATAKEQA